VGFLAAQAAQAAIAVQYQANLQAAVEAQNLL
jgi:hypothetical protein